MEIRRLDASCANALAPLAAAFRATLCSLSGFSSQGDVNMAKEELLEYFQAGYPIYAAEESDTFVGYVVCRTQDGLVWVEQLYVDPAFRRRGIASRLFEQAEALALENGEETVFNYVHPNNDAVIRFLRARGYTVLNLLEIRKPYRAEKPRRTIDVNGYRFDY